MNTAHCAYPPCRSPLTGKDPRARYCSRRHKESARRRRKTRAPDFVHWLCDSCGALYLGNPPTCPTHTTR